MQIRQNRGRAPAGRDVKWCVFVMWRQPLHYKHASHDGGDERACGRAKQTRPQIALRLDFGRFAEAALSVRK